MVSDRSNGIYRGIVVAIVGLILAGASPPAKEEKQAAPANEQEPAKPTPTISDEYKPQPDMYAESCYKADNHDSADLCAQWRSAIAAEKAADATIWGNSISTAGALLSFVSIILVLIALGQTRKANRLTMKANARATRQAVASAAETAKALEISERNADVIDRQFELSKESMNRQFRAYIKLIMKPNGATIEVGKNIVFEIDIVNYGQTPARKVGFRNSIAIQNKDWTWENFDEATRTTGNIVTCHTDHPIQVKIESDSALTQEVFDGINMGTVCIFAKGVCFYDDVFEDEQTTVISLIVSDVELKSQVILLAPTGNTAT